MFKPEVKEAPPPGVLQGHAVSMENLNALQNKVHTYTPYRLWYTYTPYITRYIHTRHTDYGTHNTPYITRYIHTRHT